MQSFITLYSLLCIRHNHPTSSPSSTSKQSDLEGPTKQDRPWAYRPKFPVLVCEIGVYQAFSFNFIILFFRSKTTWNFTFLHVNKILSIIFENSYKKIESLTQHFIFVCFNYNEISWYYFCEIHVHRQIGHFI